MFIDNDDKQTYALTNYVPAVAVIRKRLVLFIFNRFKGYLGGKISLSKGKIFLEFYVRRKNFWSSDKIL